MVSIVVVGTLGGGQAYAASPSGTYAEWVTTGPVPAQGFDVIDQTLNIFYDSYPSPGQVNQAYFFARQFARPFAPGNGGYIGLQTDVNGKRAIFSQWGPVGQCVSPNGNSNPDVDGVPGCHTSVSLPWVAGRDYRLRVRKIGRGPSTCVGIDRDWCVTGVDSFTWEGVIRDMTTGVDTVVGRISTPVSWGKFSNYAVNFLEWYAVQPATCFEYPGIRGRWKDTKGDGVIFDQVTAYRNPGDCPSTSVAELTPKPTATMAQGWNG